MDKFSIKIVTEKQGVHEASQIKSLTSAKRRLTKWINGCPYSLVSAEIIQGDTVVYTAENLLTFKRWLLPYGITRKEVAELCDVPENSLRHLYLNPKFRSKLECMVLGAKVKKAKLEEMVMKVDIAKAGDNN